MPRMQLNGKEVDVKFYHTTVFLPELNDVRRCTLCEVWDGAEMVTAGISICNPVDNFVKKTGRKLAFSDAVKGLERREDRVQLWEQFFQIEGKP